MIGYITEDGRTVCIEHTDRVPEWDEVSDVLNTPEKIKHLEMCRAELAYTDPASWWALDGLQDHDTVMDLQSAIWCDTCGRRIDGWHDYVPLKGDSPLKGA